MELSDNMFTSEAGYCALGGDGGGKQVETQMVALEIVIMKMIGGGAFIFGFHLKKEDVGHWI